MTPEQRLAEVEATLKILMKLMVRMPDLETLTRRAQ